MLQRWEELPVNMQIPEVRPYWEVLNKHRYSLALKRAFDLFASLIMISLLWPAMIIIAVIIKNDSPGKVLFQQERVTTYGKRFRIFKFRTMINGAEKAGSHITVGGDKRITKVGHILRKYRLDELPQLINIIKGDMSFVGTRPELVKYVEQYRPEYLATLLLPAGVTSEASIRYKDEQKLLEGVEDIDKVYINEVLPAKMMINLKSIKEFCLLHEFLTLIKTVVVILGKEYD